MTDILFTANGASSTVLVSGELTSGMVGLPVRFSFDSDWDGLNIVAVFDGGGQRISVPLLTDMEAVLPWEVIAKANTRLRIGAEGRKSDGSVVIPTVWANAGYIKEGAVATDEEGNPPTPGIYDQIMAAIEAGKLQGKPGEDGVSPTVSVTEIEGGHRVTITDENGKQVFDVMDGKDGSDASVNIVDDLDTKDPNAALSANMGAVLREKIDTDLLSVQKKLQAEIKQRVKTVNGVAPDENGNVVVEVPEGGGGSGEAGADGFSPIATVTQTGSGAVISITDKSGTTTATVFNGNDGKDGYTPVKGVDYFDGKDGAQGPQGVQGEKGETGAQGIQGEQGPKGDTGAPGADGAKGDKGDKGDTGAQGNPGKDGVSATHSWNGTTLTITSASGSSSANLKGEKGDKGDQGIQGIQGEKGETGAPGSNGTNGKDGANGTSVTVKSVSESTADGGSNVVTFSDGKTLTVKNGSKGSTGSKGDKGDTGATGAAGKNGADGYTPVKGTDYFTEADKVEIVQRVIESLGGNPIFGIVDENNNIVVSGDLPDGTYSVKYEMENGTKLNIGNLVIDTNVYYTVTNTLTQCTTNNSATKAVQGGSYSATITAKSGYELKSIVVKMGGTNISSTAVSGGKITIANVTGNIVITAVAEEIKASYTNLVDPTSSDFWNDSRIGSDGAQRTGATGNVVTNMIKVYEGDVIRISGLNLILTTNDNNGSSRMGVYNSAKAVQSVNRLSSQGIYFNDITETATGGQATVIYDDSGKGAYLRFAGKPTNGVNNIIITINEPID